MKDFTFRHNKNYNSLLINRASRETFLKASQLAKNLQLNSSKYWVIKPSKRGIESYKRIYREEQLMRETPVGKSFEIMGVIFKVIDQQPNSYVNGNIEVQYSYFDNEREKVVTRNKLFFYEQTLIEDVFQAVTGGCLLYF